MKAIIVIAVVLAVSRLFIGLELENLPPLAVNVYKDLAHVYMGVLVTVWYFQRKSWQIKLWWLLNFVEIVVAVSSHLT